MWRYAIGLGLCGMITAQMMNSHFEMLPDSATDQAGVSASQAQQVAKQTNNASTVSYAGRTARLAMDSRGHFITDARMNGRTVEVLVDTGATSVAINKSTARRLGIHLKQSDFKYKVNTANGQIAAASATIDRIKIGRIEVRNVEAAVLDDRALSDTLLGMSFLRNLKSFEVRNGELILTQ